MLAAIIVGLFKEEDKNSMLQAAPHTHVREYLGNTIVSRPLRCARHLRTLHAFTLSAETKKQDSKALQGILKSLAEDEWKFEQ